MSKMQGQSSSQWLKTLSNQRTLFRLGSQSTYFKGKKGIGAENKKQSVLGEGWEETFPPKDTYSYQILLPPNYTERL